MAYLDATLNYTKKVHEKNLEAEVKFCIDGRSFTNSPKVIQQYIDTSTNNAREMITTIINKYKNIPSTIEESMRFIYTLSSESMMVHERYFEDSKQILGKQKTFKKFKVTHPLYGISRKYPIVLPYKITFSTEEPSDAPAVDVMKNAQIVRVRLRLSIPDIVKDWRIDITLTQELNETYARTPSLLGPIKEYMFPVGINQSNFIELAPWTKASTIELEAEYTGPTAELTPEIMAIAINKILNDLCVDNSTMTKYDYQIALWEIAKAIDRHDANKFQPPNAKYGIKQLSTSVDGLTKLTWYEKVKRGVIDGKYALSDKPDGNRCLVSIKVHIFATVTSTAVTKKRTLCNLLTYQLEQIEVDVPTMQTNGNDSLIVDAEKVGDILYIFDVLVYNNVNVTEKSYDMRYGLISNICKVLNTYKNTIKFEPKFLVFLTSSNYTTEIAKVNDRVKPYESDGLIFTPIEEGYNSTIYKWKNPLKDNTIDFLIMKAPETLLGINPYVGKANMTLYVLFCGINREHFDMFGPSLIQNYTEFFSSASGITIEYGRAYFPIQFSPSDKPYAHLYWSKHKDLSCKVGEFLYKTDAEEWSLLKIREDRNVEIQRGTYYGNDIRIAENNWRNYHNPLTIAEMTDPKPAIYFNEESHGADGMRKFVSKIRYRLIKHYERSPWLIDLGAGRGHLIKPCYINHIGNVLFVDKDATALDTIIKRKYESKSHIILGLDKYHKPHRINLYTLTADLIQNSDDTIQAIRHNMIPLPPSGANIVTCFFAIHYWMESSNTISNFIDLIDGVLNEKGTVIITCMDGAKVFDLLENKQQLAEDNAFYITKKYASPSKFLNFGQKISVKLPFSEVTYDEYLVNMDYLKKSFINRGFTVVESAYFLTLEHVLKIPLSAADIQQLDLMNYIILSRGK